MLSPRDRKWPLVASAVWFGSVQGRDRYKALCHGGACVCCGPLWGTCPHSPVCPQHSLWCAVGLGAESCSPPGAVHRWPGGGTPCRGGPCTSTWHCLLSPRGSPSKGGHTVSSVRVMTVAMGERAKGPSPVRVGAGWVWCPGSAAGPAAASAAACAAPGGLHTAAQG